MAEFQFCRVERDGAVLTITIDRPHVLNALHPPAHAELARAFDLYAGDPELRVAILTGAGERAFCVGSDLKARSELGRDEFPPSGFAGITTRFDLWKPVIAAVNGLAFVPKRARMRSANSRIVISCGLPMFVGSCSSDCISR